MAIYKRNGRYQVKVRGSNGHWLSRTFPSLKLAEEQERSWKQQMHSGALVTQGMERISVAEFFDLWLRRKEFENSQSGWSATQRQYFRDYIGPVFGCCRLRLVTPLMIQDILFRMRKQGLAPKTQLLVFQTLNALFSHAVKQGFRLQNPVLEEDRPRVPVKEAKFLTLEQSTLLLRYVSGKPYGIAIWLQLYLGLRVSELQALRWEDIDLNNCRVTIRRVFVNRTKIVRDYPKGGTQHTKPIPCELADMLRGVPNKIAGVADPSGLIFSYRWYYLTLKRYCRELGITEISSHGLRHSTPEIYLTHGAHREDIQDFYKHSDIKVTNRYIHNWHGNIEKVAKSIRILPECSQNVPN